MFDLVKRKCDLIIIIMIIIDIYPHYPLSVMELKAVTKAWGDWCVCVGELHNNYIKLLITHYRNNQNTQNKYILQKHMHAHMHTHSHYMLLTYNLHRSVLLLLGC